MSQVVVFLDEVVPNVVQLSTLQRGIGTAEVIEEDGKVAHAQRIDIFQFRHNCLEVGLAVRDASTCVNGPYKVDVSLAGIGSQFCNDSPLLGRVVGAPLRAMVGVVFGTIDIDVHLVRGIEVELTLSVFGTPGIAIETFNHSALERAGIVLDGDAHHHLGLKHLHQGLCGIVSTSLVTTSKDDGVGRYLEIVALSLCGDERCILGYCFVADLAQSQHDTTFVGEIERRTVVGCDVILFALQ